MKQCAALEMFMGEYHEISAACEVINSGIVLDDCTVSDVGEFLTLLSQARALTNINMLENDFFSLAQLQCKIDMMCESVENRSMQLKARELQSKSQLRDMVSKSCLRLDSLMVND